MQRVGERLAMLARVEDGTPVAVFSGAAADHLLRQTQRIGVHSAPRTGVATGARAAVLSGAAREIPAATDGAHWKALRAEDLDLGLSCGGGFCWALRPIRGALRRRNDRGGAQLSFRSG